MTPTKNRDGLRVERSLSDTIHVNPIEERSYRRGLSPPALRREPSDYFYYITKKELCQQRGSLKHVVGVEEEKKDAAETEVAGSGRQAEGQTK
jgi:hypothetical protein